MPDKPLAEVVQEIEAGVRVNDPLWLGGYVREHWPQIRAALAERDRALVVLREMRDGCGGDVITALCRAAGLSLDAPTADAKEE